jgi:site-specific DNA recombinase
MATVDIYVRVSRVAGREHLISPDEQERRGRGLAAQRGLDVGEVITDLDESGGKWERPGLQRALERVRAKQSGGLIVAWLDRLSRDSEHAHRLVREIAEAGGAIYAPDAPADWTSPEGELQAGIVFAFAQYVRKRARSGFERAKERSVEAGIPINAHAPVGYRKRPDRRLEPDPVAAPVVRELFKRRAAGVGVSELADYMSGSGVRTSYGSPRWARQSVAALIRSRVYLGEVAYGKDRRFVNPDAHEPLVDLATWTAAQRPRRAPTGKRDGYLLTGLLRCAACGYAMQATTLSDGRRVYRCQRRHAGGTCPSPAWARAEKIDAAVLALLAAKITDRELEREAPRADLGALAQRLATAERRLEQAKSPEAQDAAGDGWFALVRSRRDERDAAAEELGRADATAGAPTAETTTVAELDAMSVTEKRAVIHSSFDGFALRRLGRGESDLIVFQPGTAPWLDRGRRVAEIRPLDPPAGARVARLEDAADGVRRVV